jgi:sugar lactone lactonase YvrE
MGLLSAALVMAGSTRATVQESTFTTLAGPPELGPGSADGPGSLARFRAPRGAAADSAGNVYVADAGNHTIRKVTPGGVVTTLAGLAGSHDSADGTGSAARFDYPYGVAVDSSGNVYVADTYNHTIRKVTPGGVVTTLAGLAGSYGSADGTGSAARFKNPYGVAVDSAGNVYVADTDNCTIRKVTPGGVVTTLAGLGESYGFADGTGSAARFYSPFGVAVGSVGNVYVADSRNHTIRKVTPGGVVTTLAGLATSPGSADGKSSAARFYRPMGVAVASAGTVYVVDTSNSTIRKVTPGGVVTTLAGLAGNRGSADGTGSDARFFCPWGVAVDSAGNVYVADSLNHTIRKVTPSGVVTTLAGAAGPEATAAVSTAQAAPRPSATQPPWR